MIRFLRTHFARQALTRAEADLAYAKAAYEAAVRRGDTRAQHDAWATLRASRHAALRAEIAVIQRRSRKLGSETLKLRTLFQ